MLILTNPNTLPSFKSYLIINGSQISFIILILKSAIAENLQRTIKKRMGESIPLKDLSENNDGSRVPLNQVEVWIKDKK